MPLGDRGRFPGHLFSVIGLRQTSQAVAAPLHTGDLGAVVPPDLVSGEDALINCAGHVADGERFIGLIDRLVSCVELARRE